MSPKIKNTEYYDKKNTNANKAESVSSNSLLVNVPESPISTMSMKY